MIHILTGTYQVIEPLFDHDVPAAVELDLGCGKGRFTLDLAERFPQALVLGSDVMLGRLRKVQRKVERRNLTNVELLRANSRDLIGYTLPPACIDRIHLLCPDPWPKDKHRAKRLVTTDFLARMSRVLKPDGVLHLATDHGPYFDDWKRMIDELECYREDPAAIDDVRDIQTDFEIQWRRQGKHVPHLGYRLAGCASQA
jgi:tRNA (guanine-N7-)-methyltransferase